MLQLKYWPLPSLHINVTDPQNPNNFSVEAKTELLSLVLNMGVPVYVRNDVDKWEFCLDETMLFKSIKPICDKK